MFRPNFLHTSLLLTTVLVSQPGFAGKDDFTQKLTVKSENQVGDGKNRTMIFKDNVKIRQGTLAIDADQVTVIAGEDEQVEVFIAEGKPATYSQVQDDGYRVNARANKIEFRWEEQLLTLAGNAELQQDGSMVKADSITFNIQKEQVVAEGKQDKQVVTVFEPKTTEKPANQEDKP